MSFWESLFQFLKETLPQFIGGFLLGKTIEESKNKKTAGDLINAQYENEKLKNEVQVEKDNSGKSDADILRDAVKKQSGEKL